MGRENFIHIPLDEIVVGEGRRALDSDAVKRLAASIREIGLQHPISVRSANGLFELVAGHHRLEACRSNGEERIPAVIVRMCDIDAELWEISENLHRADLTKLQRDIQVARWIELREQKVLAQSEPKPQGGRPEGGIRAASRELGIERSDGRRAVQVASLSPEAQRAAEEHGLDNNRGALLEAAKEPVGRQVAEISEIAAGKVTKTFKVAADPLEDMMVTGVSPGQGVALKAGGDAYAAAGQNAATYGQQMTQLQSALAGLQNTTTGPGTESRQAIASYMLALPGGIGAYLPGVDPKSIQAYDEANKYLTQTAQGSPNATRSDAGLNTALASSPSVHISNAAAQDVLKANMGFRRAEMASLAAFQKSGQDPGSFQNFMAQRAQQIDPRAYSIDLLSPAQRTSFIQGLSPGAKAKFFNSVRDAMGSGLIDTSALSGGASGR